MIVLLVVILLRLAATIVLLALLFAYSPGSNKSTIPEFEITDNNGAWEAQGTVAVFNGRLKPGDGGEYQFIISNVADSKLKYTFVLEEHYTGSDGEFTSFIQYRIKMNGKLIETDAWLSADELRFDDLVILAQTKHLMTLEWRWAWDGDDVNDTIIGNHGGTFSVSLQLRAEAVD